MVQEAYVTFDTAKLLKEKGFTLENCHTAYDDNGNFFWYGDYSKNRHSVIDAPTQQMTMRWLREEHHLNIEPYFEYLLGYSIDIKYTDKKTNIEQFEELREKWFNTYEAAVEAAIKYCLENLI